MSHEYFGVKSHKRMILDSREMQNRSEQMIVYCWQNRPLIKQHLHRSHLVTMAGPDDTTSLVVAKLPALVATLALIVVTTKWYFSTKKRQDAGEVAQTRLSIGILGAGAVGTIVGLSLSKKHKVVLVGRTSIMKAVEDNNGNLQFRDKSRRGTKVETFQVNKGPESATVTKDINDVRECSVIILAVKTNATKSVGEQLAELLPVDSNVTILSFQNGTRNAQVLREIFINHMNVQVLSTMINFNAVIQPDYKACDKNTDGGCKIERPTADCTEDEVHQRRVETLAHSLTENNFPSTVVADIHGVLYSKLLVNLFNPINALAGVSVLSTMETMGYRRVWAAAVQEGLAVYKKNGLVAKTFRGMPPSLLPKMLVLPDFLFWFVLRRMAKMNDGTTSSMLQDFQMGRNTTEIDYLSGEIVRLGGNSTQTTPINSALVKLVKAAEERGKGSPCMTADELLEAVGLAK